MRPGTGETICFPRPPGPESLGDQDSHSDTTETTGAQGQRQPRCRGSQGGGPGQCRGWLVMFTAPLKVKFTIIVVVVDDRMAGWEESSVNTGWHWSDSMKVTGVVMRWHDAAHLTVTTGTRELVTPASVASVAGDLNLKQREEALLDKTQAVTDAGGADADGE